MNDYFQAQYLKGLLSGKQEETEKLVQ